MAVLSEEERRELQEGAASPALREDLRNLKGKALGHFWRDGQVDIDQVMAFLTEFNEMLSHQPKPFKKIRDRDMKL